MYMYTVHALLFLKLYLFYSLYVIIVVVISFISRLHVLVLFVVLGVCHVMYWCMYVYKSFWSRLY